MRRVNLQPPSFTHSSQQGFNDWVTQCLHDLEDATREDALEIADNYVLSNVTASRTLDPTTCTLPQLAQVVATFLDDLQKRGPNRLIS